MDTGAQQQFRVVTRVRGGYEGAVLFDVQLLSLPTRALLWVQTFSDHGQADRFCATVSHDLADMDAPTFARKYRVPTGG